MVDLCSYPQANRTVELRRAGTSDFNIETSQAPYNISLLAQPSSEILPRLSGYQVIIVGAGVSGLAAAVWLTERGITCLVLDQKPAPGGRAASFRDSTTGDIIDNGQHVLIAGYRNSFRFLKIIGTLNQLSVQRFPSLVLHDPARGFCRFTIPRLPSPLHLATAMLTTSLLTPADRWDLLKAGRSIHSGAFEDASLTVAEWLDRVGQGPNARRSLWDPLAVSIMNELPEKAAAKSFVRSLRESFFGSWKNACIAIPMTDLGSLYAESARTFIEQRGGRVFCSSDVTNLLYNGSSLQGVSLKNDLEIHAEAVILAVPPYRVRGLLSTRTEQLLPDVSFDSFSYAPIVSTHLWYPADFMDHEFLGLIGRKTQWVFNRRKIERSEKAGGHLSTVISAAHDVVGLSNEEITRITINELQSVFGQRANDPFHVVVVREKRATISLTPSAEDLRPSQKTAISNLFLAGDWTATGLPATIEGAVVSGEQCARFALDRITNT